MVATSSFLFTTSIVLALIPYFTGLSSLYSTTQPLAALLPWLGTAAAADFEPLLELRLLPLPGWTSLWHYTALTCFLRFAKPRNIERTLSEPACFTFHPFCFDALCIEYCFGNLAKASGMPVSHPEGICHAS